MYLQDNFSSATGQLSDRGRELQRVQKELETARNSADGLQAQLASLQDAAADTERKLATEVCTLKIVQLDLKHKTSTCHDRHAGMHTVAGLYVGWLVF